MTLLTVSTLPARRVGVDEHLLVATCGVVLTWLWVMAVGRDISWDVVNHHVYLPFSLLSGRYRTDLFAAGPQSYQNPLGFIPFYLLVQGGAPSWVVGTALAVLNGLVFWPLHRLAQAIWGTGTDARWWRLVAMALCAATPIFLLVAGTSSLDPLSAVLVLGALALVVNHRRAVPALVGSGLLIGLAFAIKPSNAVFVLAMVALLALRLAGGQIGWRAALVWAAAAVVGAVAAMGCWSWWLWQSFGNPLFPLFNQWFRSPYAPQQAIIATRFLPSGLLDWFIRPWELAQYRNYGSTEALAPDLRPLAVAVLLLPAAVLAWRRHLGPWRDFVRRADVQLVAFGAVAYLLWLATSGNARYAVPGFMLAGLLLTRFVQIVLPRALARVSLGVLLVLQLAYYGIDGDHRIAPQAWDSHPYLNIGMPQRLRDQPFLHLSVGSQTYAALAAYMHPGGAFVNIVGQMSMPNDGPLADALQVRLRQWQGRTRFLFRAAGIESAAAAARMPAASRLRADALVARFGLKIDFDECEVVGLERETLTGLKTIPILSCAALPAPVPRITEDERVAANVFSRLEARCPRLYGPSPMATDGNGDALQRLYVNSDIRVTVSREDGVLVSHHRSMNVIRLGSAAEVAAGQGGEPCSVWQQLEVQQGQQP